MTINPKENNLEGLTKTKTTNLISHLKILFLQSGMKGGGWSALFKGMQKIAIEICMDVKGHRDTVYGFS